MINVKIKCKKRKIEWKYTQTSKLFGLVPYACLSMVSRLFMVYLLIRWIGVFSLPADIKLIIKHGTMWTCIYIHFNISIRMVDRTLALIKCCIGKTLTSCSSALSSFIFSISDICENRLRYWLKIAPYYLFSGNKQETLVLIS